MRIGLSGGAASAERMVEQAKRAEAAGYHSMWYPSAIGIDPLAAIAMAGSATERIELGTSILPSYLCHPTLMANRALATSLAMDRPGFTLGIGPSHQPVVEGMLGLSYDRPGTHTEEHLQVLAPLLRGEAVSFSGDQYRVNAPARGEPAHPVPVLLAALGPRLLRVAGELADGTILWMGNARAIETHVAPRIQAAAEVAGRPAPRIVAGLPVAVHDDLDEARTAAGQVFANYGVLPNYQRLLTHGGVSGPAEAAIVGDEASVTAQIQGLFDAGATDYWAAIFPVGDDRAGSRNRTRALLDSLVAG
jgi:F420-dependent oxidoreductase-like protein